MALHTLYGYHQKVYVSFSKTIIYIEIASRIEVALLKKPFAHGQNIYLLWITLSGQDERVFRWIQMSDEIMLFIFILCHSIVSGHAEPDGGSYHICIYQSDGAWCHL